MRSLFEIADLFNYNPLIYRTYFCRIHAGARTPPSGGAQITLYVCVCVCVGGRFIRDCMWLPTLAKTCFYVRCFIGFNLTFGCQRHRCRGQIQTFLHLQVSLTLKSQVKPSWALLSFRYMCGHTVGRDVVPHRTTVLHKYRYTTRSKTV